MRAAAPARARTWRTRNARTRLRAAVHMLPCSPAPAETSASRGFAPQVCRRSEISTHCKRLSLLPPSFLRGRLVGSFARQQVSGATLHMACSHRVLTERSHTACSHGMLTHSVRTPERPASPRLAVAPTHSLLLAPQARHGFPTRSSRFPRCRGRKGTGLPPAPQLRGPRSTTSPRSPASSSSWTRLVRRPRLAPAPPLTQHRSCAHPWQAPRPRDGRCRSWLTRYDEVRAHARREHAARAAARGASHAQDDLQCVGSRRWGSTSAGASVSARSFRVSLSCPSHQREDQLATL